MTDLSPLEKKYHDRIEARIKNFEKNLAKFENSKEIRAFPAPKTPQIDVPKVIVDTNVRFNEEFAPNPVIYSCFI